MNVHVVETGLAELPNGLDVPVRIRTADNLFGDLLLGHVCRRLLEVRGQPELLAEFANALHE